MITSLFSSGQMITFIFLKTSCTPVAWHVKSCTIAVWPVQRSLAILLAVYCTSWGFICVHHCTPLSRVLGKCLFGIPRNTECYTELTLIRIIPRNFLLYNTAKFRIGSYVQNSVDLQMKIQILKTKEKYKRTGICRGITWKSAEFRKGLCIWDSVYLWLSSVLNRLRIKSVLKINSLKLKLCEILLHQKSRNSTNSVVWNSA